MQLLSDQAEEQLINKTVDTVADMLKQFMESNYQERRYLRAEKLTEYVEISTYTVNTWKNKGLINPIIIGGCTFYDKVDIDTMMAKHKFTTK